ncbi:hypothetical protein SAMN04515671_3059 [Nakamurella panacisegetis]|uniref:SalK n=1 Tax=Nakamurella panacisegetis TaxID=1090615 RepID=A0A1H0QDE2_9ACTN|nr:hypothetical protein [Nakamurella panacisegetis]SDP15357.1 hypothetical protein SAMN04515671_3059 [Nakamurella panacisegetis]
MIDSDVITRAGRVFRATNSLHSLVYFVPEGDEEYVAAGLRPGRMGYFASRAAPMGAVGPGTVTATFYNFNPELVARHIPRAWTLATPERVLAARWRVADRGLRRLLGPEIIGSADLKRAAEIARRAALACGIEGRPLFAGHAGLEWPQETHLVFWHAVTLLREHRGDGHITALVRAELSGIEAIVTHTATGRGFLTDAAKALRMWSDGQWAAAQAGLAGRGILDAEGNLTAAGSALRAELEDETDRLSAAPWRGIDADSVDELISLGKTLTRRVVDRGAFPPKVFAT